MQLLHGFSLLWRRGCLTPADVQHSLLLKARSNGTCNTYCHCHSSSPLAGDGELSHVSNTQCCSSECTVVSIRLREQIRSTTSRMRNTEIAESKLKLLTPKEAVLKL